MRKTKIVLMIVTLNTLERAGYRAAKLELSQQDQAVAATEDMLLKSEVMQDAKIKCE